MMDMPGSRPGKLTIPIRFASFLIIQEDSVTSNKIL